MKDEYKELIAHAVALSVPKQLSEEAVAGYCGASLLAANGKVYTGVSLSGACGISFCAEVGAVLNMLKDSETQIEAIVAASNDHKLMSPCGRCREMMFQVNRNNLKTNLLLEDSKITTLEELLPERWQELWEKPES